MRAILFIAISLALSVPVHAQESIGSARELYFSASYEEALGVLNRLQTGSQASEQLAAVNQYRAFCLLALGRNTEAEQAIEAVLSADPFFQPAENDVSPRLRTAFALVRVRILPAIVQQEYAQAKAAFDRQDFGAASARFDRVIRALGEPDIALAAGRPPLSDLRVLANGFRDLSVRAAAPPPAPEPPPAAAVAVAPTVPTKSIYTGAEAGLSPPVALRQVLPNFPRDTVAFRNGVLEVLINEAGDVESAVMRTSINPRFDQQVLTAAKTWKYQPAMLGGRPVRFRKFINISLKSGS